MEVIESASAEANPRGVVASEISREIVRLHSSSYGRGPTKAKTYVHDEYVLCLMEDVFTPVERTLVEANRQEQVYATRRAFQEAVRDRFVEIVETATHRGVRSFMSMVHVDPEMSAELFVLDAAPAGNGLGQGADGTADGAGG